MSIDRNQAARFGIQPSLIDQTLDDAFGQRQVTQYFTQLNSYHVILEVTPELQSDPQTLSKIYIKSPVTDQMVPLSSFVKYDTQHVTSLSINHQGQFPAVTLSFNLAPGAALGDAVTAITRAAATIRMPATDHRQFPGYGAGLSELAQVRALPDSGGAGGGVHHPRACSTRVTSIR